MYLPTPSHDSWLAMEGNGGQHNLERAGFP